MIAWRATMTGPQRYVEWINTNLGFNPRAQANSDALSKFILDDLCYTSPKAIGKLISTGTLIAKKNADVTAKFAVRNVDLVLHEHATLRNRSTPPALCRSRRSATFGSDAVN